MREETERTRPCVTAIVIIFTAATVRRRIVLGKFVRAKPTVTKGCLRNDVFLTRIVPDKAVGSKASPALSRGTLGHDKFFAGATDGQHVGDPKASTRQTLNRESRVV